MDQVVLVLHPIVQQLAQRHTGAAQHQSQQHAPRRIAGVAGGGACGRDYGGVHHAGGGAVHDGGDTLRQHLGDGVGHQRRLLRVGHGDIDLHHLRGVHGAGGDHPLHIRVGIVHTGLANHLVHRGPRVQDDHIGVHQALGGGQVAGAQAHLGAAHRQGIIVDVHQRTGRVHGRDEKAGVGKSHRTDDDHGRRDQPDMPPERLQQCCQVDLCVVFFVVHGPEKRPSLPVSSPCAGYRDAYSSFTIPQQMMICNAMSVEIFRCAPNDGSVLFFSPAILPAGL